MEHLLSQVQQYPTLTDIKVGFTDYLDLTTIADLGNSSVCKGVDMYDRPFVAMKLKYCKDNQYLGQKIITIFQRYTDDAQRIAWCESHRSPLQHPLMNPYILGSSSLLVTSEGFRRIGLLLDGATITEDNESITLY